jgi:hypothetical protein
MERAGSLRQAAKNSALPVLILGIGAATWAYSITDPVLRVTLLSAVVVVTPLAFHALVVGAAKARLREIREAFWSVAALPAVQKLVPLKASKDAG